MTRTEPKFVRQAATRVKLSTDTQVIGFNDPAAETIKDFAVQCGAADARIASVRSVQPIPKDVKDTLSASGTDFVSKRGAFVIIREGDSVTVYSDGAEGEQNGAATLVRSLDSDGALGDEIIYDYPICEMRGVKVLMPARDEIPEFKRFIDSMVYFRQNTLMIEVGGAMEYKKHPEINEGWVEYCTFMSEYSGKTKKLQESTFPWRKNSIHCNNGGGSFLTQDEVRDIIAYCRARNIDVIPEEPCTCHCDYMLTRHPELAERCEDPYPDTFCPSNPASYELLFDLFDEIIDVFEPKIINIGHDEYYSINVCDRCRKRIMSNADILAEDINKIHAYLATRDVKTMLWCDKLMNVEYNGVGCGGALEFVYFEWNPSKDLLGIIRPTWEARNKIPHDIICLNWYHGRGEQFDSEVGDFPAVFGNFSAHLAFHGFKRRNTPNVMGGICSNWGAATDIYFRRNCILAAMVYNDILFWDSTYDDEDVEQYRARIDLMFSALFSYRHDRLLRTKGALIEVLHSTDMYVPYSDFVDGVFPEGREFRAKYLAGQYEIKYADSTRVALDVFYGEHIVSSGTPRYGAFASTDKATDDNPGANFTRISRDLSALAGEVLPEFDGDVLRCRSYFKNPHPEKEVKQVRFVLPAGATHTVSVEEIKIL